MRNQGRELSILKYLRDHRTLNIDQIAKRFWQSKGHRLARIGMTYLVSKGLVVRVQKELLKVADHYYLTPAGLGLLKLHGLAPIDSDYKIPKPTRSITGDFQHDSNLADLRIALELHYSDKQFKWVPESHIWSDKERFGLTHPDFKGEKLRSRIPDGLIIYNGQNIIVEYEHAQYDRSKFYKNVQSWEESWSKYLKLIVTRTQNRALELEGKCKEDLKRYHRLALSSGKINTVDKIIENYCFTDFDSLILNGLPLTE